MKYTLTNIGEPIKPEDAGAFVGVFERSGNRPSWVVAIWLTDTNDVIYKTIKGAVTEHFGSKTSRIHFSNALNRAIDDQINSFRLRQQEGAAVEEMLKCGK